MQIYFILFYKPFPTQRKSQYFCHLKYGGIKFHNSNPTNYGTIGMLLLQ